jgi:hypothetical protein
VVWLGFVVDGGEGRRERDHVTRQKSRDFWRKRGSSGREGGTSTRARERGGCGGGWGSGSGSGLSVCEFRGGGISRARVVAGREGAKRPVKYRDAVF